MTSLSEKTTQQEQPLDCEKQMTNETLSMHETKQVNNPLYSGIASFGLMIDDECGTRKAHGDVGYRYNENQCMGLVNRRPCFDETNSFNSKAPSSVAQALLCAAELQNTYATQPQWANAGNSIGVDHLNGGYYQPGAIYHADCREAGYPTVLRSMEKPVNNLLASSKSFSKLWNGEQRSSCSMESQLLQIPVGTQNSPNNKRYNSESEAANSFRHALIHPYFSWDELRYQPVSYPRLIPYEQNISSGKFMGQFPIQMHPSAAQPRPMSAAQPRPMSATQPRPMSATQPRPMSAEITPMTTNSKQYLASLPSAHIQQQVRSFIPTDVSTQGFSQLLDLDGPLSSFQPSFKQLIREIQPASPSADCEGVIQPSNWRFSPNGFCESDDANLRKLSDVCATSNPFGHSLNVFENGKMNYEERKYGTGNDFYPRINLGAVMSAEGLGGHDGKDFPRSCQFYLRREDIVSNHDASSSCEKLAANGESSSMESGFIREIDVVGDDYTATTPVPMTKMLALPKRKTRTAVEQCECTVCGKKLARPSTLKIHMRQHTGDRPFKCVTCGKTFAQAGLLQSHRRTHTGERPFTCVYCRKKFSHSGALKTHVRTHTGERPHKCPVGGCNLAFGDSSTLSKHTRIHTGEQPYCCDICGKRFTQSGNMHKHKKCVHNAVRKNCATKKTSGLIVEKDKSTDRRPVEKLLLA